MNLIEYFKRVAEEKKEYRKNVERIKALPDDYSYVYNEIQQYMWGFTAGDGMDMLRIQYDLLDLFEENAAAGKGVLEVTGEDVAAFCDELLRNAKTYTGSRRDKLNRDILKKLKR